MIVVAGGTGRLGTVVVRALHERGERVRVLTRDVARASHLPAGVDVVVGDVRRGPAALADAMRGAVRVISCVHGFVGPDRPSPAAVDDAGNSALVAAAVAAGAARFTLVSVCDARADHPMSLMRAKAQAEQAVRASGLRFTIVRPTAFLETWMDVVGGGIARDGKALVFGRGENAVSFVSVRDVARLVVEAGDDGGVVEIGGPESFGFRELARRLIDAHGGGGRIVSIPTAVLRVLSVVARPFSPGFARQAQAAVVLNTTDQTCRGGVVGSTRLADVVSDGARAQPHAAAEAQAQSAAV